MNILDELCQELEQAEAEAKQDLLDAGVDPAVLEQVEKELAKIRTPSPENRAKFNSIFSRLTMPKDIIFVNLPELAEFFDNLPPEDKFQDQSRFSFRIKFPTLQALREGNITAVFTNFDADLVERLEEIEANEVTDEILCEVAFMVVSGEGARKDVIDVLNTGVVSRWFPAVEDFAAEDKELFIATIHECLKHETTEFDIS